jgi:hypothetical protein
VSSKEVEMAALDLEMFTNGVHDPEAARYRIMAAINAAAIQFHRNNLYPGLGDVVELTSVLETIIENKEQYTTVLPSRLTGVDFENKALKFDTVKADREVIDRMFELIDWALPPLKALTDEGVAMFDFVNQNLSINVVGILPIYKDEGYALIPDRKVKLLHVLRYEMSLYSHDDDNYRAMKTVEVEAMELNDVIEAPESIKLKLIEGYQDLPNPATYIVDTDLDFPFETTILPVAKRKLMKVLIS